MSFRFMPLVVSLTAFLGATASSFAADDVAAGRAEFQNSCMSCHGDTGKGNGPLAKYLTIKPADLTLLSKNNNGEYPFLRVFQTIDGRAVVKTHGEGPMPFWGDRYTVQSGAAGAEPYKSYTSEPFVRARILELAYFIQTLQE
ncbi:cytochrome c [Aestuariivirga sp.]|uniref:c-type cytochrome n=1 Tax=Aestuariivirga sp. TaxID=2650926 RepID=UPI0035939BE0